MLRLCLTLTLLIISCVSTAAQGGQVKWRFRMNGMYANARPAVAADGTVYALDVRGTLYALTPEGELKWSAAGAGLGVDVAADGTVYAGNESRITAFSPDGTVKWTFTENPRALSLIGPNVGPDGNIYAVATEGLGVFSLTPQGQLRWSLPEPYDRPVVVVQNVVFGPSHLYFHANNHIEAVTLDGGARVQYVDGLSTQIGDPQPAVGPDGTLYSALQSAYLGAFNPQVGPLWSFSAQLNNRSSAPDVGTDGTVYVALNLRELFALNADGTQHWYVRAPGITDFVVASPRNDLVLGAGVVTYGEPGLLMGFSTTDGALLWQTQLPSENGGRIIPYSRPRFSPDGATAYFGTAILGQDTSNEYSYLYAIQTAQASPTPNSPPSVSLTNPSSGANFVAPASVTLSAVANDADGTISRVDFYNGSTLLGTATSAPYNYTLSNVAAGSYTFTAVAFDNTGASNTSGTVNIKVNTAPMPTPTPVPGTLQFSATTYGVGEGVGTATITVRRTGGSDGAVSVNYTTSNGTATAGSDYTAASGTLNWADGDSADKTFAVTVNDDSLDEPDETVNLSLSGTAGGATLGTPAAATLSITDDDGAQPQPNPIDESGDFVRQHYHDFLNREPDAGGLAFWTGEIEQCGADARCREVKRVNVSAAFFLSIEFQQTGYLVYRTYKAAYGDATSPSVEGTVPVVRLQEFLPDTRRIGQGVVVGAPHWEQQLDANKDAYLAEFVQRPRFLAEYPRSMPGDQFLNKLKQNAGVTLTGSEQEQIDNAFRLLPADSARAVVLRVIAESQQLQQNEFRRAFVLMQFYGYLRRNPDDPPDTDFRGWKFWLDKLHQFNGEYINAEMVKAFLQSDEYRHRFGL